MSKEIKPIEAFSKKYCSHCGRKLNSKIEPVGEFTYFDKFNEENGKRNFINVFYCPKYSPFFGHNHDYFNILEPFNL